MEELLLLLLEALAEGLLEALIELALEPLAERRVSKAPVRLLALLFWGSAAGLVFAVLVPGRALPIQAPFPGMSLVIAPVLVGGWMHVFGEWRWRRGHKPTALASFRGGAIFAFGIALVRFLMVGLK